MNKGTNMTKLYIVISPALGATGAILGVYPTLKQAKARIKAIEAGVEPGFEAVYYDVVKNFDAEAGADTMIALEG
jgi:hypothetical protein